jgi:TetR/AcrR family transcriptional regulator
MTAPPPGLSELGDERPRRKGEITRERILDAAEELFAESGFEGTTLRDVAARVGLRNPSLYNHFDSKEALYAAVLERDVGPVLRLLSEFVAQGDADSGVVVSRVVEILAQRPNLPRLVQHETLTGGQRLTPLLREWIVPVLTRGQEMAQRSAAGSWPADQIPLLVLAMYHVVVGYFTMAPLYRDLGGEDLLSPEVLARQTSFLKELVDRLFEARPETACSPGVPPQDG